jgi:hypothetical protein
VTGSNVSAWLPMIQSRCAVKSWRLRDFVLPADPNGHTRTLAFERNRNGCF